MQCIQNAKFNYSVSRSTFALTLWKLLVCGFAEINFCLSSSMDWLVSAFQRGRDWLFDDWEGREIWIGLWYNISASCFEKSALTCRLVGMLGDFIVDPVEDSSFITAWCLSVIQLVIIFLYFVAFSINNLRFVIAIWFLKMTSFVFTIRILFQRKFCAAYSFLAPCHASLKRKHLIIIWLCNVLRSCTAAPLIVFVYSVVDFVNIPGRLANLIRAARLVQYTVAAQRVLILEWDLFAINVVPTTFLAFFQCLCRFYFFNELYFSIITFFVFFFQICSIFQNQQCYDVNSGWITSPWWIAMVYSMRWSS